MSIPKGINREHVLAALSDIDRQGIPAGRQSTKFELVHDDRRYPPKVVISLAVFHATGHELPCTEFSGGEQANGFLAALGFTCVRIHGGAPVATKTKRSKPTALVANVRSTVIGRITLKGTWKGSYAAAAGVLDAVLDSWPLGQRVRYLITFGGFLNYFWDDEAFPMDSRAATAADITRLITLARNALDEVLTAKRLKRLSAVADILTVGVDGGAESTPHHVELIAIVTLATGQVRWTGKSYPTPAQQRDLVAITDLRTHCIEHAGERVLVLGCHDLNLFSPRSRANAMGWRSERIEAARQLAMDFEPVVVLQHPHTSDTANLWRTGWDGLRKDLPSVRHLAGSGRYENSVETCRGTLQKTLAATRSGDVLNIVVQSKSPYRTEFD